MRMSRFAVAPAVLLTLVMIGCTDSTPASTPTPTATTATTASPTPEANASIVITPVAIEIRADKVTTSIWALTPFDEAAVDDLSETFDSEPVVSTKSEPCEGEPCNVRLWTWDGIEIGLYDRELPIGTTVVHVVKATVGDVRIIAVDGSAVGDNARDIASANLEGSELFDSDGIIWVGRIAPTSVTTEPGAFRAVRLDSDIGRMTITDIYSPGQNYGS